MMRTLMTSMLMLLLLPAASGAQTAPGDRYLCYKAALGRGQPKFNSVEKTLADQLWTSTADVKGFASLCNPVLPAQHSNVHEVGYRTALAKQKPAQKFMKSAHTAFDQFGTHPLTLVRPLELRAPSAKVLGDGGTATVDTAGVDHFQCYQTAPPKGAPKLVPIPISITDEFGSLDLVLKKITRLCTPVNKAGEDPTAPQHPGHLVCYQAKLARDVKFSAKTVSVNNANFGPAVLVAKSVGELCVPAFKDVVPSPTPTPAHTPTPTPVHTPTLTPTPAPSPTPTLVLVGETPYVCTIDAPCPFGFSCDFSRNVCVFGCGTTTCTSGTQMCCAGGAGVCCDRATQVCNELQTGCASPNCVTGEQFIPESGTCCQSQHICPNSIEGAHCCDDQQNCEVDEDGNGTCVYRGLGCPFIPCAPGFVCDDATGLCHAP